MPSFTGQPGGGVISTRMSHYIKAGGQFDRFANKHQLIAERAVPMFEWRVQARVCALPSLGARSRNPRSRLYGLFVNEAAPPANGVRGKG